jgi:5-methylcytosine-specific restriction endonuclease McrA
MTKIKISELKGMKGKGNKGRFKKGSKPWNKNKKMSKEYGEKISQNKERALKISQSLKGKKHSEKAKRKMSESHLGRKNYLYGKHHTKEVREKISKAQKGKPRYNQRGKNHGNWQGGITPINFKIRNSLEYKIWREAVFKRDDYTCVWCGQKGGRLVADHIKPFSLFPELRFAIDNGRTLCEDCHKKTDTYGGKIWKLKR